MKYPHWLLTLTLLLLSNVSAAEQSKYQRWKEQRQKNYASFSAEYLQRYQSYKDKVEQQWGNGSELSGKDTYVIYSDDLTQKTVVDFSSQEIRIEVLADKNNSSTALMQQHALALVSKPIAQLAASDPLLKDINNKETRSLAQALLPDLASGAPLPTGNVTTEEISINVKPVAMPNKKPAPDELVDATKKRVTRVTIRMDGKNLYQRRALQYKENVQQQAQQYELNAALLLAIMQVESSFNPLAQSPVPAFGLMQIVPESAGKDVNNRVFKRKQSPNAEQLFNPDENIIFGSAYVNILDKTYLSGITNATSRLYCTIAAYNTGAGNVATVFHPSRQKRLVEAIAVINTLSSDEVYQRLISDLPYEETRKYLQNVIYAIPQYEI